MQAHVDYYLVTALGIVMKKTHTFREALKFAQKTADEQKLNVTIDIVEQRSVARVNKDGYAFGRVN